MKVKLIVDGGDMKPGPVTAQQLGPIGINIGKVIEDVNKATIGFKGMKVPVEIDANASTKNYKIEVFSPPVAELIKKELGIEKGSGEAGKTLVGNPAFETIIKIAKSKQNSLLAKDLKAAIKLIVGACVSMGVLIDNEKAKEIERKIDEGLYDEEIKEEKTDPSNEKKKQLEEYFNKIKAKQEELKKAAEAAKAAEEAKKAEEAVAGAKPAEAPKEEKKAEIKKVEKKEEKKK